VSWRGGEEERKRRIRGEEDKVPDWRRGFVIRGKSFY
jgi:hypothetical protein